MNSWRGSLRIFVHQSLRPETLLTHWLDFSYRRAAMTQMVQQMQMRISDIRLLTLWIDPECGEGEVCLR